MEEKWFERTILILGIIALGFLLYASRASAATVCQIPNGCTGTSTSPAFGQVLVGNSIGTYNLTATSSLGFPAGGSGTVTSLGLSSPNSTLTMGGTNPVTTSGTISADINLASSNQWTASTTFTKVVNLANASSTLSTFATIWLPSVTSALHLADSNGKITAYAGASCTNQFVRSLNGAGVATCNTVTLTSDVTGILPIANGGTNSSTLDQPLLLAFNGTSIVGTSTPAAANYIATSSTLTSNFAGNILQGTTTALNFGTQANVLASSTVVTTGQLVNTAASSTSGSGQITPNWNTGDQQVYLLTGTIQFDLNSTSSNPVNGGYYSIYIQQDGTGNRAVTFDAQNVRWANGTTTVSLAANSCTLIGFHYLANVPNGPIPIYLAIASSTATVCI
jgi:hypothetical protein